MYTHTTSLCILKKSQDNNDKCTMDLSSRGGTVELLGTLLVNSCFSLLLRHTENNGEDDEDSGYDYDFRDDIDVDEKPKKVSHVKLGSIYLHKNLAIFAL